jgi:hypothetical protein
MSILALDSQMPFSDAEGLKVWFLDHAQRHAQYVAKLQANYHVLPPSVDLQDEGSVNDWTAAMRDKDEGRMTERLTNWLQTHEQLHSVELTAIGQGSTISLTTVDFRNAQQFYDWMTYHESLHDLQDTVLI